MIETELLLSFAELIWKKCIVVSESWQQGMSSFLITAAAPTAGLQTAVSQLQNWNLRNMSPLRVDYKNKGSVQIQK